MNTLCIFTWIKLIIKAVTMAFNCVVKKAFGEQTNNTINDFNIN